VANFFPRWANKLPLKIGIASAIVAALIVAGVWYYLTPKFGRVGYTPVQPVPFDHNLHAKQLGLDCRYCHSYVEHSSNATVPPTQTCMNCHSQVRTDSPKLAPVRDSWNSGEPIQWTKVHKLSDFVYFNHSVHVARGIGCVTCHGPVNEMHRVSAVQPMSMSWCLECHRAPENFLRPHDQVFNMDWKPAPGTTQKAIGLKLKKQGNIDPPVNCAACHR